VGQHGCGGGGGEDTINLNIKRDHKHNKWNSHITHGKICNNNNNNTNNNSNKTNIDFYSNSANTHNVSLMRSITYNLWLNWLTADLPKVTIQTIQSPQLNGNLTGLRMIQNHHLGQSQNV
jgi:hypothetical protein